MKIKLHHVNFCSNDVPAMDEFYRTVLDLEPEPSLNAGRVMSGDEGEEDTLFEVHREWIQAAHSTMASTQRV